VDPLVVGTLALAGWTVLAVAVGAWRRRGVEEDWEAASRICGLTGVRKRVDDGDRWLEARRGTLEVSFRARGFVRISGTAVRVEPFAPEIELTVRPPGAHRLALDLGRTLADASFDAAFDARGGRVDVHASFDAGVRRLLLDVFAGDGATAKLVVLRSGHLTALVEGGAAATRAERLAAAVEQLLAIAEGLRRTDRLEERLAENARTDPMASVRLRCLEVLIEERPGHHATAAALRAALADADDPVRLAAAFASPDEGRAVLLAVVRETARDDATASRALALVSDAIEGDELERLLADALRAGKEATIAACLDGLARKDGRHRPAIVRVLASEPAPRAMAAAKALGRVGATADDVLALRRAQAAHPHDAALQRAVREAMTSIQSRLVGADHGQLALAQPTGEVSLAEDARGRVSQEEP
jgi:hypothetical protein